MNQCLNTAKKQLHNLTRLGTGSYFGRKNTTVDTHRKYTEVEAHSSFAIVKLLQICLQCTNLHYTFFCTTFLTIAKIHTLPMAFL